MISVPDCASGKILNFSVCIRSLWDLRCSGDETIRGGARVVRLKDRDKVCTYRTTDKNDGEKFNGFSQPFFI